MKINDFEILVKDKTKTDEEVLAATGDVVITCEQDIHTFMKLIQDRPTVLAAVSYAAKYLGRSKHGRSSKPI